MARKCKHRGGSCNLEKSYLLGAVDHLYLLEKIGKPVAKFRQFVPLFLMVLWLFVLQTPTINALNLFCLLGAVALLAFKEIA